MTETKNYSHSDMYIRNRLNISKGSPIRKRSPPRSLMGTYAYDSTNNPINEYSDAVASGNGGVAAGAMIHMGGKVSGNSFGHR